MRKLRKPEAWCVLKHGVLDAAHAKEMVGDLWDQGEQDSRLRVEAARMANELMLLNIDVAEMCGFKGNVVRFVNILENMVNAEYHCIERAGLTKRGEGDEKAKELLELAGRIRDLRGQVLALATSEAEETVG